MKKLKLSLKAILSRIHTTWISSPNLSKIVINLAWVFSDKGLRIIGGLFVGAWIARYLGPSQLGQLNYSVAFAAIMTTFATLGLNNVVVRRLIVNPTMTNLTLGSAFFLQCIGSVFAWVAAIVAAYLIRPNDPTSLILVAVSGLSLLFKPSEIIKYLFESRLQSKYFVIAEGTSFLVSLLLKCVLIVSKAPLLAFSLAIASEVALSAAILVYFYKKNVGALQQWKHHKETSNELIASCWPVIISGLLVSTNMSLDKIILLEYVSLENLGIYAVASGLVAAWYFLPMAYGGTIAPRLTELYVTEKKQYLLYARRAYIFLSLISASMAALMSLFSNFIVSTLYGPSYSKSGPIFSIMIWGVFFVSIVSLRGRLLMIENKQKSLLLLIFLGALTNLMLIFYLAPAYGVYGAASAFTISWALNAFIYPIFFPSTRSHAFMAIGLKDATA